MAPTRPGITAPGLTIPPLAGYPVGEKLEYQVSWWGIPVGLITLTAAQAKKEEDRSLNGLVKLICEGRSNAYLEAFYPVRVELVSYVDSDARSPRRFTAMVKRRWRNHQSVITFNPEKGTAFHQLPKKKSATVPVTPATQDGISLLYYVRTLSFSVGQTVPMEVSADGKNWLLKGRVFRTGTIKLRGEQPKSWFAFEGDAELAYPVPFFQGAKAFVWLSVDEERVPLLAHIRSRIGPVTVVLIRRSQGAR